MITLSYNALLQMLGFNSFKSKSWPLYLISSFGFSQCKIFIFVPSTSLSVEFIETNISLISLFGFQYLPSYKGNSYNSWRQHPKRWNQLYLNSDKCQDITSYPNSHHSAETSLGIFIVIWIYSWFGMSWIGAQPFMTCSLCFHVRTSNSERCHIVREAFCFLGPVARKKW